MSKKKSSSRLGCRRALPSLIAVQIFSYSHYMIREPSYEPITLSATDWKSSFLLVLLNSCIMFTFIRLPETGNVNDGLSPAT